MLLAAQNIINIISNNYYAKNIDNFRELTFKRSETGGEGGGR